MKNLKMISFEVSGTSWEQKIIFLETKLTKWLIQMKKIEQN